MSINNEDLNAAILNWIATFEGITHKSKKIQELSDGVTLTEIMNIISPGTFELSKINFQALGNWALCLNNLEYLHQRLEYYYKEFLFKPFDKKYADVLSIAKNNDVQHIYNLIELVLGVVVQCEDKEEYIKAILTLDETHQTALMHLIEKILEKCSADNMGEMNNSFLGEMKFSPSMHGSFIQKMDHQEKQLYNKLEEVENENNQLTKKLTEILTEKEGLQVKINDLNQELSKKNEEIRSLVFERQNLYEKLNTQDVQDELNREIKLRDFKITEINRLLEEMKLKHEIELHNLKDELSEQKMKVISLSKIEGTLDFYKQKYEDYTKMTTRLADVEQELELEKARADETAKNYENLTKKVATFNKKIEDEQTLRISLELEITRKTTEIEGLISDKKRMEAMNMALEDKLHELNKLIDKIQREQEDTSRNHISTDRVMTQLATDFQEIVTNLEKENKILKSGQKEVIVHVPEDSGEKELLEKEIEILKKKCNEIEAQNQTLKDELEKSQDIRMNDRMNKENQHLKEEVERWKKNAEKAAAKADLQVENATLRSEVNALKKELLESAEQLKRRKNLHEEASEKVKSLSEELNERVLLVKELTEKLNHGDGSSYKSQKLQEELGRKDEQILELNAEVETLKRIMTEVGDQKEEELRILSTALTELAVRNMEIEVQLNNRRDNDGLGRLGSAFPSLKQRK